MKRLLQLPPRQQLMISAALSLSLIGGWYVMRFQPVQQRLQESRAVLESTEQELAQARVSRAGLPKLRGEVAALEERHLVFLSALPSATNYAPLTRELREAVDRTGARIKSVRFTQGATSSALPAGVNPVQVTVDLRGTFAQVFDSLRALESTSRFTEVSNFRVNLPAADRTDPELTAVVDLVVFTYDQASAEAAGRKAAAVAAKAAREAEEGTK